MTSSCAAIYHTSPEPKIFSEVDWNEESVKEVEVHGIKAPGGSKYRASKTLAERGRLIDCGIIDLAVFNYIHYN